MENTRHIIRKQNVLVELNGIEADGLALQGRLTVLCEQMIPTIERVLDRYGTGESHVYIDHIDIDAGTTTLENLERNLPEAVARALDRFLREHIPVGEHPLPFVSGNIRHTTAQSSIHEAFIYFLRTGSLPWSFRLPVGGTLEQVVSASWQEAQEVAISPISDKESLLQALADAVARKRLVHQFPPNFLEALLFLLSPEAKEITETVLQTLHRSELSSAARDMFIRQLWETVFAQIAAGEDITTINLVGEAWDTLPTATGNTALADILERLWPLSITRRHSVAGESIHREPRPDGLPRLEKARFTNAVSHEGGELADAGLVPSVHASPDNMPITQRQITAAQERIIPEKVPPASTVFHNSFITEREHPDARDGIYIDNAGLVLLHSFLPQFFGMLGIALEDKVLRPGRALCLLHYLATGQALAPEYELVLPKILCGIPLLTPVETDLNLTVSEKEEAVALLEAVIRHWDALRNTSPDALRGTFLLRPGKVTLREDGEWLLQVEQKSWDVLLERLPWGISMIKLPWMERMLWVEWR